MKKKKQELPKKVQQVLDTIYPVQDDPEGSYTGVPAIPNEMPLQDADDL